jgi:RNA polymerase sigma-70 factor (ECF subfamily)
MAQERTPDADAKEPSPFIAQGGPTSDQQLVADILRRDRKATAQFVSQHTDAIYAYVRHRLSPRTDLVDDMVQDVFVAALGSLAQFRGTSSLRAWLLGIARHKVEDFYRKQLRAPESLDDESAEPAVETPLQDEAIDRQRAQARTQAVLRQLPAQYSIALLWRYWENRSVRDIAEATGKTEKAIERTLARARARFRALWEHV